MKVTKKFQFTKEEAEALQIVKTMLQEVGDDDYETLLREIHCHSESEDFYEDIYCLCRLAEQNAVENP